MTLEGTALEEVEAFPNLGSVIDRPGGKDADVIARIGKARVLFIQLKNIWTFKEISQWAKLRLFSSHIKPILPYTTLVSSTKTTTTES